MAKNKRKNYKKLFKVFLILLLILTLPLLVFAVKNVSTQTSSHAMDNYPYYFSQYNKSWQVYGEPKCLINAHGCYPTSLAMAMKKFGIYYSNPLKVARAIGSGCGSGTNVTEANRSMKYVRDFGLAMSSLTGTDYPGIIINGKKSFNYERAKQIIDGGSVILLGACMKYYTSYNTLRSTPGLHAVLVIDVNPKTHTLTMLDPTKEWGPRYFNGDDDVFNGCSNDNNGYYFAYAITRP